MQSTRVRTGIWNNITRLFPSASKDRWTVGFDLQGNKYTEEPIHDDRKPTRRIVYAEKDQHPSEYTARQRHLPAQLKAWLTHTRASFPTHEELQADIERQQILRHRVLAIEARDREEQARQRASRVQLEQPSSSSSSPQAIPEPLAGSASTESRVTASASEGIPPSLPSPSPSSVSSDSSSAGPSSSSDRPPASSKGRSSSPTSFTAPTPESDPLRRESQRALQEQQLASPSSSSPSDFQNPAKGLPSRPGDKEWKPEGWSPAVGARRGE